MGRKICVVTGTRAEYGLLYWFMKEIEENHSFVGSNASTKEYISISGFIKVGSMNK